MSSVNLGSSTWNHYREEHRIGRIRYAFRRLGQLSRQRGFHVGVLILPFLVYREEEYFAAVPAQIVAHEANRAGFDVIDPVPAFLPHRAESLRLSPTDPIHPNQTGHEILADQLKKYLAEVMDPSTSSP